MNTALINGAHVPTETASISIFDRGFLFADSVYEVVPVYAGRVFQLGAHLDRLAESLQAIGIANPYRRAEWRQRLESLIDVNGRGDLSVYIQVTRGAPPKREHRLPVDQTPNVVAFCQARQGPAASVLADGVAVISRRDTRWARSCIKSTSLLANVLAAAEAHRDNAAETLFTDADDGVLEGSSSNVFAVIDGRVVTPSLRESILSGITRSVIQRILARLGQPQTTVEHLPLSALRRAEEIWISSSTREVLPVTQLDGQPVGDGRPGPVWAEVQNALQVENDD